MTRRLDPAVLEAVRHGSLAIAEEMRFDLMRAARSPVLREAGDLSCALTDDAGLTVAQGNDIPMHLGVMGFTVRSMLARRHPALRPGDVLFMNHPEVGGNHLPDVKAVRPIFDGDRLWAFAVALAHWPDVGGALPGSYVPHARDLNQEGLVLPPLRLFDADGEVADAMELVLANVRGGEERAIDIRAQAAATAIAERRLTELAAVHGADTIVTGWSILQEESERRMRRALAHLPDGVYDGEDALDDDRTGGEPVAIRCRLTIRGDAATFDYRASADQVLGPVNTTRFITAAATSYVAKAVLAPAVAANAGLDRPLQVLTRPGSVCDAHLGAPIVAGNHETSQRIADAALRALAHVVPDQVVAAGMGSSGLALFSGTGADGEAFFLYETHAGGSGASAGRAGDAATRIHMSNVMNTPAEVIEAEYPLRVEAAEIRTASGGAGARRGGDGLRRRYRVLRDGVRLTTMVERCRVAPPGLDGGADGEPSRLWLERHGERTPIGGKASVVLMAGDAVVVETAGGGGYGAQREKPTS
jgi:N-methylhydantoinase B